MREEVISVTEAARNFADCVNRVRYQNVTFVLLKNGVPVARIVPDAPIAQQVVDEGAAHAAVFMRLPPQRDRSWRRLAFSRSSPPQRASSLRKKSLRE